MHHITLELQAEIAACHLTCKLKSTTCMLCHLCHFRPDPLPDSHSVFCFALIQLKVGHAHGINSFMGQSYIGTIHFQLFPTSIMDCFNEPCARNVVAHDGACPTSCIDCKINHNINPSCCVLPICWFMLLFVTATLWVYVAACRNFVCIASANTANKHDAKKTRSCSASC